MGRAPYESLLSGIIVAWRESAETFTAAGGELNTPEHLASLRAATDAHLRTVGWTIEEWEAENKVRRDASREEMHARIRKMQESEGQE